MILCDQNGQDPGDDVHMSPETADPFGTGGSTAVEVAVLNNPLPVVPPADGISEPSGASKAESLAAPVPGQTAALPDGRQQRCPMQWCLLLVGFLS